MAADKANVTSGVQATEGEAPRKRRVVQRGPRITRMIAHIEGEKIVLDGVYASGEAHKMLEDYDRLIAEGKNPQRLQHTAEGK